MNLPAPRFSARTRLAEIARREGEHRRQGDARQAGPAIEPYLALFREALNRHCESERFSDRSMGYDWCCAFVFYCCREAGFRFPPKPLPTSRYTLAAVPAWREWAVAQGFFLPGSTAIAEPGDIVLFHGVATGQPLDHLGVVVEVMPASLLCAEGNVENRTGLFARPVTTVAGYVRLPEGA